MLMEIRLKGKGMALRWSGGALRFAPFPTCKFTLREVNIGYRSQTSLQSMLLSGSAF
jgi:hypothetical protein